MMDTMGIDASDLFRFRSLRAWLSAFSSRSRRAILSRTRLLSISSFISPGPRPPIPPISLDMTLPFPVNRGNRYFSCASSTCTFPSLLWARRAKMSRISWERSITFNSVSSPIAFTWEGFSSWSKMSRVAPLLRALMTSSFNFPSPSRYLGFMCFGLCKTLSRTRTSLERASSASSSRESSSLCRGFVETLTSIARSRLSSGPKSLCRSISSSSERINGIKSKSNW